MELSADDVLMPRSSEEGWEPERRGRLAIPHPADEAVPAGAAVEAECRPTGNCADISRSSAAVRLARRIAEGEFCAAACEDTVQSAITKKRTMRLALVICQRG